MSFNFKIRSLQVLNHCLALLGLLYAGSTDQWSILWLSIGVYVIMLPMAINMCYHRLLSHHAYKTTKFWEYLLSVVGVIATIGSTVSWVGIHRLHHASSDKPADPHSPHINRESRDTRQFNSWQAVKAWIGLWGDVVIPRRYVADLIGDPFHAGIHRYYFKIIFAYCAVLMLIDPALVLFAYAIPACITLHVTSFFNVAGHSWGYRNHNLADESRNNWICSVITLGDGWHNNHHADVGKFDLQENWWELDPCSWAIRLIKTNE